MNGSGDPAAQADFFRDMVNLSLDVITLFDQTGRIIFQSPSVEHHFGFSPQEMLGRSVFEYVHPEDQAGTAAALQRVFDGAVDVNVHELRFRCADGSWRFIEAVGRLWDIEGVPHVLVNTRDVTRRREALDALARSEALFSKIFAVSSTLLSITDPDTGEFIDVNDTWLKVAGYERHEVIGRTALDLGVWGTAVQREAVVEAIRASGGSLRDYEATVHTRTGPREMLFDVETFTVSGQTRLLMSGTDVTERRHTEAQLRQAQKMEAVGQLTGGVAHDFNNLLGVVLGNAELLRELVAGDAQLDSYADAIIDAAERGAVLTQQLLAFSRRQVLSPQAVDISGRLRDMRSLLQSTLGANVLLDIAAMNDLWPCMVDPAQLDNAILNLILNARDALPQGGRVRVTGENVTLERALEGPAGAVAAGVYVRLTIADDGEGMDAETLGKACDPFFTTKGPGRGTGLGLSMVFGFARQSGGQLMIDSELGSGTGVSLLLPRATLRAEGKPLEAASDEPARGSGETILVLEDEPQLLELIGRQLEELGYRVLRAPDEAAVRRLLDDGVPFDLLVSDVLLTGPRTGPEVAADVQALRPGLPVLYISGYPAGHGMGSGSGKLAVLRKPFTRRTLAQRVSESLAAGTASPA